MEILIIGLLIVEDKYYCPLDDLLDHRIDAAELDNYKIFKTKWLSTLQVTAFNSHLRHFNDHKLGYFWGINYLRFVRNLAQPYSCWTLIGTKHTQFRCSNGILFSFNALRISFFYLKSFWRQSHNEVKDCIVSMALIIEFNELSSQEWLSRDSQLIEQLILVWNFFVSSCGKSNNVEVENPRSSRV